MNEHYYRRQFLIGASSGCTCLILSFCVYLTEGALAARGSTHERSFNSFVLLLLAISWLFAASLMYSRMLHAQRSEAAPEPQSPPVRAGRLVTGTVLLTLVIVLMIEGSAVETEASWPVLVSSQPTLFGLPVSIGVAPVGVISVGPLAVGVISVGGVGVVSIGGIGILSLGGVALGIVALGGASCGLVAVGGAALGYVAIGGGALGVYVLAGGGRGRYVLSQRRKDPQAVEFFGKYLPHLKRALPA